MKPPPRTWLGKFADAFRGLFHALRTQTSFAAHIPVAGLAVAAGLWLGLSAAEWGLVTLAIGMVIGAEVFNTALEDLARAVGRYPDDGIRDALDTASAGVLVAVTTAVVVGCIVLGPRLLALVA